MLLDTGPLVTFLAAGIKHHAWVCEQWQRLRPPLFICEPVLTEAAFLLKREGRETDRAFALLERGVLRVGLEIEDPGAKISGATIRAALTRLPSAALSNRA